LERSVEYRDYYATLGVSRTASQAEIKRAFRKLAREHHPDVRKGDRTSEQRFKEINEANAVLSDPQKRKLYEQLGTNWEAYQRAGAGARPGADPFAGFGGFGPGNIRVEYHGDPEDLAGFSDFFRMFFGGAETASAGRATKTASEGDRRRAGPIDLDDLFARVRPGNGRASGSRPRPGRVGRDAEAAAEIDLEEAFRGTTRLVEVVGKRLQVTLPPGIASGQRLRLSGKAPEGGDLYVRVTVRDHPVFRRTGADLHRDLPVSLQEALLGAEVPVETLKGTVLLRLPPETQSGRTFRLAGQGMPRFRGEGRGDLYARAHVVLPSGLDEVARDLVQRLADHVRQPDPRRTPERGKPLKQPDGEAVSR
jgi:curved DNA-binding protein